MPESLLQQEGGIVLPKRLEEVLSNCDKLPTPPEVALKVLDLCKNKDVQVRALGRTIQQDPALAARVLHVVNSAFFGLSHKVASVSQAISLLGVRKTKIVVLGFSVVQSGAGEGNAGFDVSQFWGRALSKAIAAELVAKLKDTCSPDEAFASGLLQDIGVLALWRGLGKEYEEILEQYRSGEGKSLHEVEQKWLGTDHAKVGAWLLQRWQLPEDLIEAVRDHHEPDGHRADGRQATSLAKTLQVAEAISTLIWRKEVGRSDSLQSRDLLGITDRELEEIIVEGLSRFAEVSEAFSLNVRPQISEEELLDAARAELGALAMEVAVDAERQRRRHQQLQRATDDLAESVKQWQRVAKRDPLTGLNNRLAVEEFLNRRLDEGQGVARTGVIIMDMDSFKQINDTYGHPLGDRALCTMAKIIRENIREVDIAARFGGDEFLVLLQNVEPEQVKQVAQRIRQQANSTLIREGKVRFPISVSVGAASSESLGGNCTYEDLLAAADRMLYVDKRNKKKSLLMRR